MNARNALTPCHTIAMHFSDRDTRAIASHQNVSVR
jgi:hypothetical protein